MFPVRDANSCRAHIEVAMLVVATVRFQDVELEFDVNRVGGEEVVKHNQGRELAAWSPNWLSQQVSFSARSAAAGRATSAGGGESACLSRERERCLAERGSVQEGEGWGRREGR